MNKEEFIKGLRQELGFLPPEELDAAIEVYERQFREGQEEEEVVQSFGSPKSAAEEFCKDYYARRQAQAKREETANQERAEKPKRRFPIWAIVLLVIIALPVLVPLQISLFGGAVGLFAALLAVLISVFAAIFGIIVAIAATCIGLIVGGVGMIFGGIFLTGAFAPGLLSVGMGIMAVALGILTGWGVIILIPAMIRGIVNLFSRIFRKRGKRV